MERLVTKAVFATFNRHVSLDDLEEVIEAFEDGLVVETGERVPSREYVRWMREIPGLREAVRRLGTFDGVGRRPGARARRLAPSSSCSRASTSSAA